MLIEKFIEYLKIEKNYSVNTLTAYKKDLMEFQVFIKDNYDKFLLKNILLQYNRALLICSDFF